MVMVRIYGWVEKSVAARSASGKSIVELDRRVFLFFPFFSFFFFFIMTWSRLFLSLSCKSGQGEGSLWGEEN